MNSITATNYPYRILLLGACGSGKSSLINAVTGTNQCRVSVDGSPETSSLDFILSVDTIYIDTPGYCKNPSTEFQIPFPERSPPSMIWLVVNYKASVEDCEFKILNSHSSIPAIIIVNKFDKLTNESEVENFNKPEYSTNRSKLAAMRQRLMDMKQSNPNIRHIVIMSLVDEDNDERPPIGIDFLKKVTDFELGKQHTGITESQLDGSDLTIAVIGYSSSGKSSLVNAVLRDNKATISVDGSLTTKEWTCYPIGQVHLWDSPAVTKCAIEQQKPIIPMESKIQLDIIWLIINYQSWDIDDAADLCSIFHIDSSIPVIVIINKVDVLRKISDLSERDLVEFSRNSFISPKISTRKKLIEMINLINNKFLQLMNLKAITLMSLCDDDESDEVIGVDALFHITREHLKSDNERFTFDILKQSNVTQTTDEALEIKKKSFFQWLASFQQDWMNWWRTIRSWFGFL